MKIAVIAPTPVPFTIGGAENLFWGLQNYINEETPFQCELIKLPTRENDLLQIIESYKAFSKLDLTYFDTVISTKYPSWMITHSNHVCYMLHTLRGLYDTYHFMNEPENFEWVGDDFTEIRDIMAKILSKPDNDNSQLDEFYEKFGALKSQHGVNETLRFPGPFARQVVHFLDAYGLAPQRIKRYAAISQNVRMRKDYFPKTAKVSVWYPPPRLTGFYCGNDDYLFTLSRLDGPKRMGLLIEAMRHVKSNIPLLIGGTGPELERLRELADGDPRIKFLGFLSDSQMLDYYSNALAVPFVPYDEDYGYITVEAMKSAKPVLTVTDSGGPNEFVIDGETGFSVAPDPLAIAERIDYLCDHRDEARIMGKNAQKMVSYINWQKVVEELTNTKIATKGYTRHREHCQINGRQKIVVAVTFPIYPPRGGGQSRIYHLYKNLAQYMDVEIVSIGDHGELPFSDEIAPRLKETRIPKSAAHQEAENRFSESVGWIPVTDIVMSQCYKLTPDFVDELKRACCTATIAIASHPYLIQTIREVAPDIRLWFEAHNVEYDIKRSILPESSQTDALLEFVRSDESRCWKEAEVVFACAERDLITLESLYGPTEAKKLEVPNGVSLDDVSYINSRDRRLLKEKLGVGNKKIALFMGSWHGPNIEATKYIIGLSNAFPDILFFIVGSAGLAFSENAIPKNLFLLGAVDDEEKNVILGSANIALNPMISGSGSNLKMLDYFSAGIPVISTPFGARGIEVRDKVHFISAEIDSFVLELSLFLSDSANFEQIVINARKLAETQYAWPVIAEKFYKQIQGIL